MSIEMHVPPHKAQVIPVITFSASHGSGTPEDPERLANYYFSLDGELLACYDPINGPPDTFWPHCLKCGVSKAAENGISTGVQMSNPSV